MKWTLPKSHSLQMVKLRLELGSLTLEQYIKPSVWACPTVGACCTLSGSYKVQIFLTSLSWTHTLSSVWSFPVSGWKLNCAVHCGCCCCCPQMSHCCRCCWWHDYFDRPHFSGHFCFHSPQGGKGHLVGAHPKQGPQNSHHKSLVLGRWWWRSDRSWSSQGERFHRRKWTRWRCRHSVCHQSSSWRTVDGHYHRWRACCAGLTLLLALSACCPSGSHSHWAASSCCDRSWGSQVCRCSKCPFAPFHSARCGCPFWYQNSSVKRSFWPVSSHWEWFGFSQDPLHCCCWRTHWWLFHCPYWRRDSSWPWEEGS